jgi:hypothetical protein
VGLNYTAWATNWIDPEHVTVRLLMLGLMLISLVMSAAIPRPSAIAPWSSRWRTGRHHHSVTGGRHLGEAVRD